MLKEAATVLSEPLSRIFNLSLQQHIYPNLWKEANVAPVHKKESRSLVENYRPISLLSCVGKVMERCVHKHLCNFFVTNSIISGLQSGFTQGDSATFQLLDLYNTFCKALDDGEETRIIFFDISKAFDRVWHRGLLLKLKATGIRGNLLDWVENYLNLRKQRVVLQGTNSEWKQIKAGVPQGSILGPLFFLIYINDIIDGIKSNIRLFADDTSLFKIIDTPINSADILSQDLLKIIHWAKQWLVTFNPTKTEEMIITRKLIKPVHPDLLMNDIKINEVTSHKHLGLILSNNGGWKEHINHISEKGWVRINILRGLKFKLDRLSLEKIYTSFIRPILEYGDYIWDNCTSEEKEKIEKIQIEAMRIVTGATKLTSIEKLYLETGWEKLTERRRKHKLCTFYKMINSQSPLYLQNLVPQTTDERQNYNLRSATNFSNIRARTKLYDDSFLPATIRLWNQLPQITRDSSSLTIFKSKLNSENPKIIPNYYYCGSRLGQIYHTRLRLDCSSLRDHLFRKHILSSPLCDCKRDIESTKHYLLDCPQYTLSRNKYLLPLQQNSHLSANLLIFGDPNLHYEENRKIFIAVQNYILDTKRFS